MHPLIWIANYIWGIADDVLRDLYVRGKHRDVILPMTVLRRLDAVLEGSEQAVLDMEASLDGAGVVEQDPALRQAAGQAFDNTSRFTLNDLRARANRQQLTADFQAYLDGFSPNVQDILDNFEFRNQIPRLSRADALGTLIEKLHLARHQPEPGAPHRRIGEASRPRQPRHGHDLRGAGAPLQRGEQRGGGRALDPARRGPADGETGLPARRRPDNLRHLLAVRRRLRHRRHADCGRGDAQTGSTTPASPPTMLVRGRSRRARRPIDCWRTSSRRRLRNRPRVHDRRGGAERMVDWSACPAVERSPKKISGAWAFAGTRVPVYALFENLAGGATIHEFVEWFPDVEKKQVRAVLEHEARALREALAH